MSGGVCCGRQLLSKQLTPIFSGGLPPRRACAVKQPKWMLRTERGRGLPRTSGECSERESPPPRPSLEGASFVQLIFVDPSQARCWGHSDGSLQELLVQGTQGELIPRAGEGSPSVSLLPSAVTHAIISSETPDAPALWLGSPMRGNVCVLVKLN